MVFFFDLLARVVCSWVVLGWSLSLSFISTPPGTSGHILRYWGGGLLKYTVLIKYTGVIKYTARKPILSVEICEIKYTVFVYIFLTKKILRRFLHKKSEIFFLISVVRILCVLWWGHFALRNECF